MIRLHGIPVYWGVETDAPDRTFITRAFLNEALPPYRIGTHAFRIRVSHRHWLHIGTHRYRTEVGLWGLDTSIEQIRSWGLKNAEEEDTGDHSGTVEVRPLDGERSDQLH